MLPNSLMFQTSALPLAYVKAGGHKKTHLITHGSVVLRVFQIS